MNDLQKKAEKCNLSICAIMKDEGPYLVEWLEFHKLVGVEKFYLYDNSSNDNSMIFCTPIFNREKLFIIIGLINQDKNMLFHIVSNIMGNSHNG